MGLNHLREIKQPDEIKKGLETCIGKCTGNKPHCPYHSCGDGCMDSMNRDALALIQQLEADNAELKRELDAAVTDIHKTCSTCKHYYYNRQDDDTTDCLWFDGCKIEDHWEWRGISKEGY